MGAVFSLNVNQVKVNSASILRLGYIHIRCKYLQQFNDV